MAIAVANCCFSVLSSTVKFRYSVSCNRHLATSISTSHASLFALSTKATNNKKRALKRSSSTSPLRSNAEKDNVSQKKLLGRSKDEKSSLYADGISGRGNMGRPQSPGFKSFGTQRKDKKEFQLDSREQQVEPGHLQDATFLNAVVKFTAPIPHLIIPFLGKSKDNIQALEVLS